MLSYEGKASHVDEGEVGPGSEAAALQVIPHTRSEQAA